MTGPRRRVQWTDLGRTPYDRAWSRQHEIVEARKAGRGVDRLLLVEHEPVVTLGRRADPAHILIDRDRLAALGIDVYEVERGGDVTYHGPGQLVGYPLLDLRDHRKDVRWYSDALLATVVRALGALGVEAEARDGLETGVWVADAGGDWAKIAALGVRIERWITYHGFAVNVDPDLSHFDLIVPCGIQGVRTTSLSAVLGRPVTMARARAAVLDAFGAVFGVDMVPADLPVREAVA